MPILQSLYHPPLWLRSGHIQTCWPIFFRIVFPKRCQRHRIATPDNDFLDVDIYHTTIRTPTKKAVIISHGLEGNSRRKHIIGMANMCLELGCDVFAWNMRSCSDEMNKTKYMYHMGQTQDLATVVSYALACGYTELALIGFSLGGNQILRWLGNTAADVPAQVRAAFTVSVPCDLPAAALVLDRLASRVYMEYFMRSLRHKVQAKAQHFSSYPSVQGIEHVHTFREFDGRFTAPVYGYDSADAYWRANSSLPVLKNIRIPTYLLMAQDDPFCAPSCFPIQAAEQNPCMFLEVAPYGGHVGFVVLGKGAQYWSEQRAKAFLQKVWLTA